MKPEEYQKQRQQDAIYVDNLFQHTIDIMEKYRKQLDPIMQDILKKIYSSEEFKWNLKTKKKTFP